ncbi:hypothetical protein BDP27DRAFT_1318325 [Rhodocollybia butyracea]|uniref:Uncharacterized protein n=1 Tax=Rhodocollybia butyracea TaxID=206335 RepID=A0A9P5Q2J7_9AGAR|nr:hypothetical protein BDP27DRAFT_1318325 [Rhodocollybia butyracea]
MCFSLTCVKMWEVTEDVRFLYLRIGLQRKSWSGDRIILLGSSAEDLPQGLLTEEDREKLKEMAEIQESSDEESLDHHEGSDESSDEGSDESSNEGSDHSSDNDMSLLIRALRLMESPCLTHEYRLRYRVYDAIPEAIQWFSLQLSHFTCKSSRKEDRWMLRNLTKKELVIKSKGRTSRGLMQALFLLSCWSNDYSFMRCDGADAVRGSWAGDRADVTLYSLHELQHKDDPVLAFLGRVAENNGLYFFDNVLPFW